MSGDLTSAAPVTPQVTADAPATDAPPRSWPLDCLHLASLSAIVFAQPLLDRLQRNPGYLSQERLTAADIAAVATALLLLVPAALALLELAVRLVGGAAARRRVHVTLIGLLLAILAVAVLNQAMNQLMLRYYGLPGAITVLLAAPLAWWLAQNYRRRGWVSSLLTAGSIGLVIFPLMFFSSRRIAALCFPEAPVVEAPRAGRPAPVIMIVFDGMCGMSLLNEQHQIDAVRYPNFARLGGLSTWYRNASTVHYRTDNALPSILTGRIPPGDLTPFVSEYPVNLFTLLNETGQYEMTVFEPFTRLCPSELRYLPAQRSAGERILRALATLGAVYLDTSFPHDVLVRRPDIPPAWFCRPDSEDEERTATQGLMIYGWDTQRHSQIEHFLNCLRPSSRPALRFLHVVLPHYPSIYLPSGARCINDSSVEEFPVGSHGPIGEDWGPDELATRTAWRRYLLQLRYVDRQLGRILDRLQERRLLDEALLIVTADHGGAFQPGLSRRDPTPETLPDIVPTPLFIKLPGQRTGEVSDRNVESIDILPTLADVIDLEVPIACEGASLIDPRETPRPRKTLVLPRGQLAIAPDFPEKYRHVDTMIRLFGSGDNERLWEFDLHPEWASRPRGEFRDGPDSRLELELEFGGGRVDPREPEIIPCFFKGRVMNADETTDPALLAIEVNGRIAGCTRTLTDPEASDLWSAIVDEAHFHVGPNDVRIYEAIETGGAVELRPCRVRGL